MPRPVTEDMRIAVLVFPGTSGDEDCLKAVRETIARPAERVWHETADLSGYDLIILPGGSSYGGYLRPGAIARVSPAIEEVRKAAEAGKFVLGINDGFRILLESGLLPGAMLHNPAQKFRCAQAALKVVRNDTPFTRGYAAGESISLPIAHGECSYYCDATTLERLERGGQIVFAYADGANPDGSVADIAGIVNERGNVLGMMPHPERATQEWLGSKDGARLFASVLEAWRGSA